MRKTVRFLTATLLLISSFNLVPVAAHAASKVLTVSPATVRPTIPAGSSASGSFQIVNQGQSSYPVQVYSAPYSIHNEEYNPEFTPIAGKPNPADWFRFTVSQSDLKQNQSVTVGYTVSVPAGTQPGGYYAVAFVEAKGQQNGAGVVINQRVGEIFYIHVPGKVREAGKVDTWDSPFWQKPPILATLKLENSGGIDYDSTVHLTVSDLFGNAKYSLSTQKEVLPQTVRHIPITWDKAPAFGLFKVSGTATVFGKTVSLPAKYVLVISQKVRIILLCIVGVLIAYVLGRLSFKHRRRKQEPKPAKK
jgi:hypothetical protein